MKTIIPPATADDRVAFGDSRLLNRIWAKTQLNNQTGCWEWAGRVNERGYGYVRLDGRMQRVHRVAFETLVSAVPQGLVLDHLCRVRHCLNPAHLEPVTSAENTRRAAINVGRKGMKLRPRTHCPKGHPYDEANTAVSSAGKRRCKACAAARKSRYRQETRTPVAQTPVSLHKAPLPQTEFVDRDGDVWVVDGHNGRGELVLVCPNPHDQRDAGEGESHAWTLHEVQSAFGPLIARSAVAA